MITEIVAGHVVDRIAHQLTDDEAHRITTALAAEGVRVEPVVDVYHVLHLWALAELSTPQEVHAIAAFKKVTDARVAWHGAVSRG